jgi:hypothetical protein
MKNRKQCVFFLPLVLLMGVSLAMSCKSNPPPPGQEDLDQMNAAMKRAADARQSALDVQGQVYFPDEWNQAESDNAVGRNAEKDTVNGVKNATDSFISAAETYETVAEKSAPLFAKDLEDARAVLSEAKVRADQSQKNARGNNGQAYFPDEWEAALAAYQKGENAPAGVPVEMKSAAGFYVLAADGFDDIAARSGPMFAKDKGEAQNALNAAAARAEKSRQQAAAVNGERYFPDDWESAEATNTSAKNAEKSTLEEIAEASALYAVAADAYDDIAARSGPMFAKDKENVQKLLNDAIARADKSRQQAVAVDGQTYLPNDWKNAEAANTSAKNAKKSTVEEIAAATTLYAGAADAYDDIAKRSGPMFTKDKDANQKALNAAIARAEKSKKDATDAKGQANFPTEWRNAETKDTSAKNAKRGTPAEMKAAIPLYVAAADAYDDIVRKTGTLAAEESQKEKTAQAAKTRAEKERQAALDVKANVAVTDYFNEADKIFQQAVQNFNAKSYGSAEDNYGKAADQFIAAANAAVGKRSLADDTIGKAKQRSAESAAFAVNTGYVLEENLEEDLEENDEQI